MYREISRSCPPDRPQLKVVENLFRIVCVLSAKKRGERCSSSSIHTMSLTQSVVISKEEEEKVEKNAQTVSA